MLKWVIAVIMVLLTIALTGIMISGESSVADEIIIKNNLQRLGDILFITFIGDSLPEYNSLSH